ncbi:hypothetical protein HanIR_Chr05g0243971 [Helianthus annuus]|nr:hypothetical protein HanIR_Chr05g0243971 [Helianthus annuus]
MKYDHNTFLLHFRILKFTAVKNLDRHFVAGQRMFSDFDFTKRTMAESFPELVVM